MLVDAFGRAAELRIPNERSASRWRPNLTVSELQQLGLNRVGYVCAEPRDDGEVEVILRGADGLAVARAESLELIVEAACQLGLALVPVH